jgi:hypothetical protein
LFNKELEIPIPLLQVEALEGRYIYNQDKIVEIKTKIKTLRSGYNGEKTINYHLKFIPEEKYHIFHDLRLQINNTHFQIDVLLLSSKLILIIEGKNHSGTLLFEKNQMIQVINGNREVYENPISQASRHRILLKYLFGNERLPNIPIEYYVVVCRASTEIIISPDYSEAEERVLKANDLLTKIEKLEKNYTKECLKPKTIQNICELLIKKHTPKRYDILKMFGIAATNIITGVHCPNCSSIPMNFRRKTWICPECQFRSKDAHIKAVNDYFLLIKTSITNSELRIFLHLPSSRSAHYILSLLNLSHIGKSRDRLYYQS